MRYNGTNAVAPVDDMVIEIILGDYLTPFASGFNTSSAIDIYGRQHDNTVVSCVRLRLYAGSFVLSSFNAATETYEDLIAAGVIDPAKVVRSALQNAASVASLLITTECAIVDKPEKPAAGAGGPPGMGGMGDMGGMGGMPGMGGMGGMDF